MAINDNNVLSVDYHTSLMELLHRQTGRQFKADELELTHYPVPVQTLPLTQRFYGGKNKQRFIPDFKGVPFDGSKSFTCDNNAKHYDDDDTYLGDIVLNKVVENGFHVIRINNSLPSGHYIEFNAGGYPVSYTHIKAAESLANGANAPFIGEFNYPVIKINLKTHCPYLLLWDGDLDVDYEHFLNRIYKSYGLYFEDRELEVLSTNAPLSRGDNLNVVLDGYRRFYLQVTDQSMRFNPNAVIAIEAVTERTLNKGLSMYLIEQPPNSLANELYHYQLQMFGGLPPYQFTVTDGLPPCPIDPNTGVMDSQGQLLDVLKTYVWTMQVSDSLNDSISVDCQMTVNANPFKYTPPTTLIQTLPDKSIDIDLGLTGGLKPYTFEIVDGTVPDSYNVDFTGTGTLTVTYGLPAGESDHQYVLRTRVSDNLSGILQKTFSINVRPF